MEKASMGRKQIRMYIEKLSAENRWKTGLSRNVVDTFSASAHTALLTIHE